MNQVATINTPKRSVLVDMATRFGMEPQPFEQTLRATVVPNNCSREQFAAFLLVAKEYDLNPLTKEIYAFPTKGGGIQPIVSIDGWVNLINSHSQLDGIEFEDHHDDGKLAAITCRLWRKDRSKPIVVTEYFSECSRPTEPWQKWPHRMLRHKALIQCARYAFGFAGIVDPDEAERMGASGTQPMRDVTPTPPSPPPASPPAGQGGRRAVNYDPETGEIWDEDPSPESAPPQNRAIPPTTRNTAADPSAPPAGAVNIADEHQQGGADGNSSPQAPQPPSPPPAAGSAAPSARPVRSGAVDAGDIPAELDRRPKPAPQAEPFDGEPFDGEEWLKSLENAFSACEDIASLHDAQQKYMTPHVKAATPQQKRAAQEMLKQHMTRIMEENND